jgi:hypothetical protein
VYHNQAASEDSSGGIANPPPDGSKVNIECLVDLFVAAGCLSSNTLPELADNAKDSFSTIRLGDACGNPHLKPSPLEKL